MNQNTLKREYSFEGKGLHTGSYSHMTLCPAAEDTGILFVRTDAGVEIPAIATNVTKTDRSTTISCNGQSVVTIEHLMSALTGLGIDNAVIKIDNLEVPILTGSAEPYVQAIMADGLQPQSAPRRYVELTGPVEVRDDQSGSWVRLEPADSFSVEITADFHSHVLGVQKAAWAESEDYAGQIAPCRTFVFFHELEALVGMGLVKGGDVNNAIVVVEHPVTEEQVSKMCSLFGLPTLTVDPSGYLTNLVLHFPNECGRHKLLDIIGDIRLVGGFPKAKVTAFKPGHRINTMAAKAVVSKQ